MQGKQKAQLHRLAHRTKKSGTTEFDSATLAIETYFKGHPIILKSEEN